MGADGEKIAANLSFKPGTTIADTVWTRYELPIPCEIIRP